MPVGPTFRTLVAARHAAWLLVLCVAWPGAAAAQQAPVNLADLSLESLMDMRITSVSREAQEVLRTSSAVFVITQQDIRRSGMTDIAELLRMVPGLNVAQINSNIWAISARGFNGQYATKLLVLVDGRSVYDPGFSGVFWHLQNLVMEDIERIEVIRGPGATMWGANAVNGVISITTKRAESTQGGLVAADVGIGRPGEASARFGGGLGSKAFYRVFAKQTSRSALSTGLGEPGGDDWNGTDVGVRVDWDPSAQDSFNVQAGAYRGVVGSRQQVLTSLDPLTFGAAGRGGNIGGHLLARWNRSLATRSNVAVQVYYDTRTHTGFGEKDLQVFDLDMQHALPVGGRQHLKWGFGYRHMRDVYAQSLSFRISPASETVRVGSAFVQDEISLANDRVLLTVGSKFEHSSYTGGNAQPAVRMLWQPTLRQSLWGAASRAVRTANRAERGIQLVFGMFPAGNLLGLIEVRGQEDAVSEELAAIEAGYRYQPNARVWFDITAFRNTYAHLSAVESGAPFVQTTPVLHLVQPLYFRNTLRGTTSGTELAVQYLPHDGLTLKGSYALLRVRLETDAGFPFNDAEGETPRHQGHVGSTIKIRPNLEASANLYMVTALPTFNVDGYTRLDLNTSWRPTDGVRLNLVGQNLLGSHVEFGDVPAPANAVQRSVHAEIVLGF